jgi:pimeloyl-ACP methyl ester carboxylesterase
MSFEKGNGGTPPFGASSSVGSLQFKTIDGLRIRYATSGAAIGRSILLLSPWPESIYAFIPTWEVFSSLGPVVAIDLPGFGRSEGRPDIIAPEAMGKFIPHVLSAFDLEHPHVVGPDIGTSALLFAAANHPGLFSSLIIGGGATDPTDVTDILEEFVNAPSDEPFRQITGAEFVQGAIESIKNYAVPPAALTDYLASYAGERFIQSVAYVRHYAEQLPRITRRLGEIQTPCQIIVGRFDPYVPVSNAELLHRGLPKSKLDVLECGHFVWEDAASEYGRLVSEWISDGYSGLW